MLLTGNFRRTLDEKRRLLLPKQVRHELQVGEGGRLFVTPGNDGSLSIYTDAELTRFGRTLAEASPGHEDVRSYLRLFYAQTQGVEVDRNGRIRIPSELADLAALGGEVMLLGVGNHLELWNLENWERFIAKRRAAFDAVTEATFAAIGRASGSQDDSST